MMLSFSASLLICFPVVPSLVKRGTVKISTITVNLSVATFGPTSFYFTHFAALWFGAYTFKAAMSSYGFALYHSVLALPVSGDLL